MNILIIMQANLTRSQGGGANRIYNLTRQLQKAGHKIMVLEPKESKEEINEFKTFYYTQRILGKDFSTFLDLNPFFIIKFIKLLLNRNIDIIQVESPWGASIINIIHRIFRKKTKVVYSSQNFEAGMQKELRDYYRKSKDSSFFKVLIFYIIYPYTKIIEKYAVRWSDLVICVSNSDKELLVNNYKADHTKINVIHNGTDFSKILKSSRNKEIFGMDSHKLSIVFHGSYDHPPNYEAIFLIKDNIYPEFKNQLDKVEFIIAGVGVPTSNKKEGLKLLGFIEDIFSLLKSSDIAIVPIVHGAGTKLKVLDYMGVGLPIVSTSKGMEGIEAISYRDAIIVENVDKDFIEAIKYLSENKTERELIGENGKLLAEKEYGWESIGQKLIEVYDKNFKN